MPLFGNLRNGNINCIVCHKELARAKLITHLRTTHSLSLSPTCSHCYTGIHTSVGNLDPDIVKLESRSNDVYRHCDTFHPSNKVKFCSIKFLI